MPSWAIRPVLPSGTTFNGQIVYPMTNITIPNTLKKYIDSMTITQDNLYINKYSGFETKKFRVNDTSGTDYFAKINMMLVGDLPLDLMELFRELAIGCNGSGIHIEFYDDIVSDKQYTGRWIDAGDFVENSYIHGGVSINIHAFEIEAI